MEVEDSGADDDDDDEKEVCLRTELCSESPTVYITLKIRQNAILHHKTFPPSRSE